MPSTSPFPDPAATLPGEEDILASVWSNLADDTAKLVYADWLEDRDDPRGKLLRECVIAYRAGKKLPSLKGTTKPWRDLVGITLFGRIRAANLTKYADAILRQARPAISFKSARRAEAKLVVGTSKLGGSPDLPPELKWPRRRGGNGLSFLGQFNLADLSTSRVCEELPAKGILSIFYDTDAEVVDVTDTGAWRVFHFPDVSKLKRRVLADGEDGGAVFHSCKVAFSETITLPDPDSPAGKALGFKNDDEAEEEYQEKMLGEINTGVGNSHHILGYPFSLQEDPLRRKTMRHLLTIDSDDHTDWMWGDSGLLYFTIREENLKAHRFDRVRVERQCC